MLHLVVSLALAAPSGGFFLSAEEQSRATWQESLVDVPANADSFTYTIRGGASLGNYEAGYTWALLRALRNRAQTLKLRPVKMTAFTGASAGSINAVLGAEAWLKKLDTSLEDSLLWHVWVEVGVDQLLPEVANADAYAGDENGLFSRRAFEPAAAYLAKALTSPDHASIDPVSIGVSLTNLRGVTVERNTPLKVATQRAFAQLTMSTEADGTLGLRESACDNHAATLGNRVPLGDGQLGTSLYRLVSASSAVPLVFSPVCLSGGACFVDGGVFDNEPVRLASELNQCTNGAASIALALDPNVPNAETVDVANLVGVEQVSALSVEDLDVAINAEMLAFGDQGKNVVAMTRKARVFSSGAGNFAGFYAQAFRRYDYYAGVYDAARTMTRDRCSGHRPVFWSEASSEAMCESLTMRELYNALAVSDSADAAYVFAALWENDPTVKVDTHFETSALPSPVIAALTEAITGPRKTSHVVSFATEFLTAEGVLEQLAAIGATDAFRTHIQHADDVESRELAELVNHTDRWSRERVLRLLSRLYYVEHTRREAKAEHAATPGEMAADTGQLLLEQQHPWSGVALRMNNSIPDNAGLGPAALRLLPNVIDFDAKNGGASFRYNFLLGFGEHFAITAPITPLVWQSDHEHAGGWREFGTVGLGGHVRFNTIVLTSAEVLALFMVWDHNAHPDSMSKRWSIEAGTYLFVNKLHLAVEYGAGPAFQQTGLGLGRQAIIKLGVADLPGLSYWLARLVGANR